MDLDIDLDDAEDMPKINLQENKVKRFADVTSKQLDEIEKCRLSEKTNEQTKWAVSTFKGKYI